MAQPFGGYQFKELARAEIGDNVWCVISIRMPGNEIVVAKGHMVSAEGRHKMAFMSKPEILPHREALEEMRNCLSDAIEKLDDLAQNTKAPAR